MKIKTIIEKVKKGAIGLLLILFSFSLQSCEQIDDILKILQQIISQTGWLADDEEMDNIPEDIVPFDDDDAPSPAPVRTEVSLEHIFPPIGDQGQYGTCVAWSVGYNLKTALNAIEKGWSESDLRSTSNQTSPKDLWFSIPGDSKGTQCNGTNFEPAMDALIAKGAASLSASPYSNLGSCTGTGVGDSKNKLTNYRKIASETEGLTVSNFKGYLNAGRPIAIGAKLGDRFMNWDSNTPISSDTYNQPGMQHAYHAMVLVGYDDDRSAFRVRNSWGTSWGDNGSIWVDYDFFCRSFCFAAFVAQNVNSISAGSDGTIGSGDLSSGSDLLAYWAADFQDSKRPDDPLRRVFYYDVYNSGDVTITSNKRWMVTCMYYNATKAKDDSGIIFMDYYTDEFGSGSGNLDASFPLFSSSLCGGFWNNEDIAPGKKAGEAVFGDNSFYITYPMPKLSGNYYLVLVADAFDVISEANEDNNFYFITAANGKPLVFNDGIVTNIENKPRPSARSAEKGVIPERFSNTENQTVVKPGNLNAYTPQEIKALFLHEKKTGRLQARMSRFIEENGLAEKTANK